LDVVDAKEKTMNTVRCPLQSADRGESLLSYLDRRLDPESTAALDRHVSACVDCAHVVAAQRIVWRALDEWEPVAVSADFDDRLMARIAAEPVSETWWRRLFHWTWWKPAMPLAAVAILLTVAVWRGGFGASPTPAPLLDSADIQQMDDTLSDLEMLQQLGLTEPVATQSL
jgi:anti-sigma factor RsiW